MPPVPVNFTNPTGKQALLYSLRKWLVANVLTAGDDDFQWSFLEELQPSVMPRIELTDFRFFDPGATAYGDNIFPAALPGQQKEGRINRCMVQFDIYTDQSKATDALEHVYQLRDRLVYALENSGMSRNSDNTEVLPPITVVDPENADFDTGTVARMKTEEDNHLIENYYGPNTERPNIHQVQLIAKLEWFEMRS